MLRDCYCIPEEEGRYDDSKIEITDELIFGKEEGSDLKTDWLGQIR